MIRSGLITFSHVELCPGLLTAVSQLLRATLGPAEFKEEDPVASTQEISFPNWWAQLVMLRAPFKLRGAQHWPPNLPQPLTQMASFIYFIHFSSAYINPTRTFLPGLGAGIQPSFTLASDLISCAF